MSTIRNGFKYNIYVDTPIILTSMKTGQTKPKLDGLTHIHIARLKIEKL